jgi:glutamate dehydrogenase/leucine dehydrogenase
MIYSYGVAVRHYYTIYGGDVKVKAIVQGFGNVGSALLSIAEMGAKYWNYLTAMGLD